MFRLWKNEFIGIGVAKIVRGDRVVLNTVPCLFKINIEIRECHLLYSQYSAPIFFEFVSPHSILTHAKTSSIKMWNKRWTAISSVLIAQKFEEPWLIQFVDLPFPNALEFVEYLPILQYGRKNSSPCSASERDVRLQNWNIPFSHDSLNRSSTFSTSHDVTGSNGGNVDTNKATSGMPGRPLMLFTPCRELYFHRGPRTSNYYYYLFVYWLVFRLINGLSVNKARISLLWGIIY